MFKTRNVYVKLNYDHDCAFFTLVRFGIQFSNVKKKQQQGKNKISIPIKWQKHFKSNKLKYNALSR